MPWLHVDAAVRLRMRRVHPPSTYIRTALFRCPVIGSQPPAFARSALTMRIGAELRAWTVFLVAKFGVFLVLCTFENLVRVQSCTTTYCGLSREQVCVSPLQCTYSLDAFRTLLVCVPKPRILPACTPYMRKRCNRLLIVVWVGFRRLRGTFCRL